MNRRIEIKGTLALRARMLAAVLLLLAALPLAAADRGQPQTWIATHGTSDLWLNEPLLAERGASLARSPAPSAKFDGWTRWKTMPVRGALGFAVEYGHDLKAAEGALEIDLGMTLKRRDGALLDLRTIRLVPSTEKSSQFRLLGPDGTHWFTVNDAFQDAPASLESVALTHMGLRVTPALAKWLGSPHSVGTRVGLLFVRLRGAALPKTLLACNTPAWPGSPGVVADVELSAMNFLQAECKGGSPTTPGNCNNTGSNPEALVKITPSVQLRNVGTADIPWIIKFARPPAPPEPTPPEFTHPYPQPDTHPFLVWNVYRLDANGRLSQIGRSPLKHAFSTQNLDCECGNNRILAPQCTDTYDAGSNDESYHLGPRRDLIARTGSWGRCGSQFDANCDAVEEFTPPADQFLNRLVVHETELMASLHPGARWFVESWYVVRDDVNLFNTMSWKEFTPQWVGHWNLNNLSPALPHQALIDFWVDPALPNANQRNTLSTSANGRFKLAVRVTPVGAQFRYDYAIMNLDFSTPVVQGAEPNLRVLRNLGLGQLQVPMSTGATATAIDVHDGTGTASDNWTSTRTGSGITFAAPSGNSLDWGSMYRWSFVSDASPVSGNASVLPAEAGNPTLTVATLVPGGVPDADVVFRNGFEN